MRLARLNGHLREKGTPFADNASSGATPSGLVQVRATLQQGPRTPLMCGAISPCHRIDHLGARQRMRYYRQPGDVSARPPEREVFKQQRWNH